MLVEHKILVLEGPDRHREGQPTLCSSKVERCADNAKTKERYLPKRPIIKIIIERKVNEKVVKKAI